MYRGIIIAEKAFTRNPIEIVSDDMRGDFISWYRMGLRPEQLYLSSLWLLALCDNSASQAW
jgi:hypothetical protein